MVEGVNGGRLSKSTQQTWKMLGGLRDTLLALESQLLLIKYGIGILLLLLCGWRWWLREIVLATETVLSRDRRSRRVQRSLALGNELSLICKVIIDILLLKNLIYFIKIQRFIFFSTYR
jgi:hypothetical protein